MKIAILSRNNASFSCYRLRRISESRGHKVDIINPSFCCININSQTPSINYYNRQLDYYDAIIPRINSSATAIDSIIILRQFEMLGTYILNKTSSINKSGNKLYSLQILLREGFDLPVTIFANSHYSLNNTDNIIKMIGGTPIIIKLLEGSQGIGVILAENKIAARSIIDTFRSLGVKFLIQEFISDANNRDIRCFVVGNKIIAAIERQAKMGDFRSNLHCGGIARLININAIEQEIAIRATSVLGLDVAGIDILRSNRGPLVIEVNASPGLQGIEKISKIDIATEIIKFIEDNI